MIYGVRRILTRNGNRSSYGSEAQFEAVVDKVPQQTAPSRWLFQSMASVPAVAELAVSECAHEDYAYM